MAERWIVTALGQDRPGIVAGVTKALYTLGCNLEDSAMTRLEGEFAIMLIFEPPRRMRVEQLRKAFEPLERRLKLAVHLKPLSRLETTKPIRRTRPYLISVYGADRPGIVFRVSELLANSGVNISDVETRRAASGAGRGQASLYRMLLEVEVPPRVTAAALEQQLLKLGRALKVEVGLQAAEAQVL